MKVKYKTENGRMEIEFDVSSDKELFRKLHHFQEVFEEKAYGKPNGKLESSDDIRYIVRKSKYTDDKGKEKEAEYFEKRVITGPLKGYKKAFGVLDDGSDNLFPKRKAPEDSAEEGFNGWHKWKGKES